jgi:hypothetical protein
LWIAEDLGAALQADGETRFRDHRSVTQCRIK